ncbi:MAG: alpha-galactosidase, partial [Oscillospiraceae bacterium]|nr:alpha-galactosidase [Candidatus Equicaccousia limihippi]
MKSTSIKPSFSFLYNGTDALSQCNLSVSKKVEGKKTVTTTVYDFGGGFTVTTTCTRYADFDSIEWVNRFENHGNAPSGLITELWYCASVLPFPEDAPKSATAYLPEFDDGLKLIIPKGSTWEADEFGNTDDKIVNNSFVNLLFPGDERSCQTSGGRSSEATAPFFRLHRQNAGYIAAVGWTGQWRALFKRTNEGVLLQSGIQDAAFRVNPGESFRTASVVIMPYEGSEIDGCNRWRRLVKTHYSLIGTKGREETSLFCAGIWGGMTTQSVLDRIRILKENKLPFTHIWMDAGWYGMDEKESPDEFEGNWWSWTGDWRVNPTHHPDGMQDIKAAVKQAGLRFLLWFEPERIIFGTPITQEHPEYFLGEHKQGNSVILNLGDPDAWNYCFDTLCERLQTLGVDVYRQDFNTWPLDIWRANDSEERRGITEILHINGLYRLWDAMLEKFPHLIIDNCASGGRRIDIETLRRSVPMWRSDAQCPANFPIRITQMHSAQFGQWMPYSGTGTGRAYDTYRFRSSYAPALTTNFTFSERDAFGDDPEKLEWLKAYGEEYLRVQPYLSCDMYPLLKPTYKDDAWAAFQYNRPEREDGVILVYRREKAPYKEAVFPLSGLCAQKTYCFTDVDTGEKQIFDGKTLMQDGLSVIMDQPYSSKVIFYTANI